MLLVVTNQKTQNIVLETYVIFCSTFTQLSLFQKKRESLPKNIL
jgi:hypothetical protein